MFARHPRTRARHLRAGALAALLACVLAAAGVASGASSTTVVSMEVPSAISITNNCTGTPATVFGTVQPGTPATTATGAGVCNVSWTSSNDSSMLRIAQRDGTGTAMTRPTADTMSIGWTFFTRIDTVNGTTGYAVGAGGTLGRTTDSGASWTTAGNLGGIPSEIADFEIDPTDATVGWAVGYGGRLQRVTNLGGAWVASNRMGDIIAKGWNSTDVVAVTVVNSSTVLVGGWGQVAKTTDTGATWTVYSLPTGVNAVTDLEISPTGHIWMTTEGSGFGNVWRTTTGGGGSAASWTQFPVAPGGGGLGSITVPDATHGYAVGSYGYIYSWDGTSWTWRGDYALEPDGIHSVASPAGQPGWAVVVTTDGSMLRTTNSGVNWARVDSKTGDDLHSITAGTGGMLATGAAYSTTASTDGGATWTFGGDAPVGRTRIATAVDPTDGKVALQVGSRGSIWRSTNAGSSWSLMTSGTTNALFDVEFESSTIAWAVGANGTILRSADGGVTWSPRTSGTTVRLRGVSSGEQGHLVVIGDGGTVVRTTNGGTSFTVATPYPGEYLTDVSMATRLVGVMTSHDFVRRTTDGGATWTLPTSTPGAQAYAAVDMVSATVGYVATDWANLWKTTDGGANWTAQYVGADGISDVHAATPTTIYAALGSDVMRSTDGGATWSVHASTPEWVRGVAAIDGNAMIFGGHFGLYGARAGSTGADQVADYGAAPNSWAASAQGMFGVCLQSHNGSTVPAAPWTADGGTCTASDADPWRAVPIAPIKVASVATAGNTGSADFVFGVRFPSTQPAGTYSAGIVFEAIAPNA